MAKTNVRTQIRGKHAGRKLAKGGPVKKDGLVYRPDKDKGKEKPIYKIHANSKYDKEYLTNASDSTRNNKRDIDPGFSMKPKPVIRNGREVKPVPFPELKIKRDTTLNRQRKTKTVNINGRNMELTQYKRGGKIRKRKC